MQAFLVPSGVALTVVRVVALQMCDREMVRREDDEWPSRGGLGRAPQREGEGEGEGEGNEAGGVRADTEEESVQSGA